MTVDRDQLRRLGFSDKYIEAINNSQDYLSYGDQAEPDLPEPVMTDTCSGMVVKGGPSTAGNVTIT